MTEMAAQPLSPAAPAMLTVSVVVTVTRDHSSDYVIAEDSRTTKQQMLGLVPVMCLCNFSEDRNCDYRYIFLKPCAQIMLLVLAVSLFHAVCGTAKDVSRAFQLYADLRQKGTKLDGHAYGALIGAVAAAIKAKSNDKKGQLVLLERACDLLEDAEKSGVFLEAAAWNALLMCAGKDAAGWFL